MIDLLRRKRWERQPRGDAGPSAAPPAAKDPFESLELYMAVTSLGRRKARVVEAFYYDGLSVREIASEMGLSDRAVEGYLRRARQALRSLLPDPRPDGGHHA